MTSNHPVSVNNFAAADFGKSHLNQPHGGVLVDLMAPLESKTELRGASRDWLSWDLTARQMCDLELLLNGGFSPLRSFLGQKDYESVCSNMRLADGTIWPMPIMLDVNGEFARQLKTGQSIALRDPEGVMLAALHVTEVWQPNLLSEAELVFGTTNPEHPGVGYLVEKVQPFYVSGRLEGVQLPTHYDFRPLRLTPAELRAEFA
ncbi:MAG TPA: hypothetical protein VJP04_14705, partial [Terriglobales bacterium]|nr:hypothetical protein [Terriglobales bacterium]